MSSKVEKGEAKPEEAKAKASLTEGGAAVIQLEDVESLHSRGYGVKEGGLLKLAPYEALYLLDKRSIELVNDEGESVSFEELLQRLRPLDEDVWTKYLIYRDLRSRGYAVREGFGLGLDFRMYERGEYGKEAAKYIVLGILEGKPIPIEKLIKALRHSQSLKKKLILAVVNRRGEVVYYSLSELMLSEVEVE